METLTIYLIIQLLIFSPLSQGEFNYNFFLEKLEKMSPNVQKQFVSMYDMNSNGKIEEIEFEQISDDLCFGFSSQSIPTNSQPTQTSIVEKIKQLSPDVQNYLFESCDLNHDGEIDPNEFQAGKKKIQSMHVKLALYRQYRFFLVNFESLAPSHQKQLIQKIDLNKNQKIEFQEFQTFKTNLDALTLKLFDANQNGILDNSEKSGLLEMKNKFIPLKGGK